MDRRDELDIAMGIVEAAAHLARSYFRSPRARVRAKGERDVVTAADEDSERLMVERLRTAFPGDGIVGEEGTALPESSGRSWYLDPLDGTLNYSRGVPVWCVSLSLFEDGQPVLGVISDPMRGELYSAARGLGAFCNGSALTTGAQSELDRAVIHVSVDFHDGTMGQGLDDLVSLAPRVLRTRNLGSAALGLAYVAAGRLDAMLHRFAHPWDYGAGVALVREAGGSVSTMDGQEYSASSHTVLAAASDALRLRLLEALGPGRPAE